MVKKALFLLLDEYADWEGAYLSSQLNQKEDWEVSTVSVQQQVRSIGGFQTTIDYLLTNIPAQIDLFVMIGSKSWGLNNDTIRHLVTDLLAKNVVVAAICGAADYLARNGLLNHYKHTGNTVFLWKDYSSYTNSANFVEEQAVRDRNLITANGTASLEFTKLVLQAVHADDELEIEKTISLYQLGYYAYFEKYGSPF